MPRVLSRPVAVSVLAETVVAFPAPPAAEPFDSSVFEFECEETPLHKATAGKKVALRAPAMVRSSTVPLSCEAMATDGAAFASPKKPSPAPVVSPMELATDDALLRSCVTPSRVSLIASPPESAASSRSCSTVEAGSPMFLTDSRTTSETTPRTSPHSAHARALAQQLQDQVALESSAATPPISPNDWTGRAATLQTSLLPPVAEGSEESSSQERSSSPAVQEDVPMIDGEAPIQREIALPWLQAPLSIPAVEPSSHVMPTERPPSARRSPPVLSSLAALRSPAITPIKPAQPDRKRRLSFTGEVSTLAALAMPTSSLPNAPFEAAPHTPIAVKRRAPKLLLTNPSPREESRAQSAFLRQLKGLPMSSLSSLAAPSTAFQLTAMPLSAGRSSLDCLALSNGAPSAPAATTAVASAAVSVPKPKRSPLSRRFNRQLAAHPEIYAESSGNSISALAALPRSSPARPRPSVVRALNLESADVAMAPIVSAAAPTRKYFDEFRAQDAALQSQGKRRKVCM